MKPLQTLDAPSATALPTLTLDAPGFSVVSSAAHIDTELEYRLFRLDEIGEDKPAAYRQAIANVLSGLNSSRCACIYLLSGRPQGIDLYVGVATDPAQPTGDIHEAAKMLKASFEGNFLGAHLVETRDGSPELNTLLSGSRHFGLMTGVPSLNHESRQAPEDDDSQGIERLVNSLLGETWQLTIVACAASDDDIRDTLEQIYDLASEVSAHIKYSEQHSENSGYQFTDTSGSSESKTTGTSSSDTRGTSKGSSITETSGSSDSKTTGTSSSDTRGKSKGTGQSQGTSSTRSSSSSSTGDNNTESINTGTSESRTNGYSQSGTTGNTRSSSHGRNDGTSESRTTGHNQSGTTGSTRSSSHGRNDGTSESRTTGTNDSQTTGKNTSRAEGHSGGRSIARTSERTDKRAEGMLKHLSETLVERFLRGRSKGMHRTSIYLSAENSSTYHRLARGALSTFQGNQSGFTPLRIHKLPDQHCSLPDLLQIRSSDPCDVTSPQALAHSTPIMPTGALAAATWLNTEELALIAGMPGRELPGLKIRKSVDFALNTHAHANAGWISAHRNPAQQPGFIPLGHIVQHGRSLPHSVVRLSPDDLCKHVFVTGVTGAGKTTTCLKLLIESKLPFLVIEPAKTEYRALHGTGLAVEYYCLGREDMATFRLNPFELVSRHQSLSSHIDTLKATLAAVFPMEAAMPQIVEEAIIRAYAGKGWMIHENENLLTNDPWAPDSEAWPTFSDMITELDAVIRSKGMGREFEEKYRGSLVARLTSLTLGTKGRMLNTRRSMRLDKLLDKQVVIELEELKDEQDKALFMGLILARLAECMKQRHREQPGFRHLTLVEEAHRLLSRPEPGDPGSKKMGVEMFANLLAEVRKYGEGLIIADQIPNKLVPDVIKNTNTKLVHRLFAADDRNTIGDAMGLSDEQKDFLPMLQPGETIIYCGGWHGPVRLKITETVRTDGPELDESDIRRQGRQQLWEQRHFLLPHLAAHPLLDTPDTLADFMHEALMMLNLLLRLDPKGTARIHSAGPQQMLERMRDRLLHLQEKWLAHPGFDTTHLANGLCRALQDCAVQNTLPLEDRDIELFQNALVHALQQLRSSLKAFDKALCTGEMCDSFDFIHRIDSI